VVLSYDIRSNKKAAEVIACFRKVSKSAAKDIITAIDYMVRTAPSETEVLSRIDAAHIMCVYMKPTVEDVVSLLLHIAFRDNKASCLNFKMLFKDNRAERYYQWTSDAYRNPKGGESSADNIDYYIMMRVCDRMMEAIIRSMNKRGIPDTVDINAAYNFAKDAYYRKKRPTGEPFLTHSIYVAEILAELGVESSIVAAALLHGVVEETDRTVDDIKSKCGSLIAKYVDAVTSVNKQYATSGKSSEYSYDKAELEHKSLERLSDIVGADERMIFALYIKAAAQIQILRDMDKNPLSSGNTDVIEVDFLPLLRKYKLSYFVDIIEDLTWRASNPEFYDAIKKKYEDIVNRNKEYVSDTKALLNVKLADPYRHICRDIGVGEDGFDVSVYEYQYLNKEVYGFIKDALGADASINPDDVNKNNVPVCDFDIVIDPVVKHDAITDYARAFVKLFNAQIAREGRVLTELKMDEYDRCIITLENRHRTAIRLCFIMRDGYTAYRIGNRKNEPEAANTDNELVRPKDIIYVKLRNGNVLPLPNGATVIDVAFAIHHEVGYAVRSATINDKKGCPITTRLHDGDHIIVEADTYRENGITKKLVKHVRLSWINYTVTEKARKFIVRELAKRYGEDDPRDEYNASDAAAENVISMFVDKFCGSKIFDGVD